MSGDRDRQRGAGQAGRYTERERERERERVQGETERGEGKMEGQLGCVVLYMGLCGDSGTFEGGAGIPFNLSSATTHALSPVLLTKMDSVLFVASCWHCQCSSHSCWVGWCRSGWLVTGQN